MKRGRENTYIHLMVQGSKQQVKDYRNSTDVDNHGHQIWLVKQFKSMVVLQTMFVTASELSPLSQKPQLPSLAARQPLYCFHDRHIILFQHTLASQLSVITVLK